ncbi:hydantoinase/oxoprolinase family protein [Methanolapillus millepedarum]|uniref:Hydantoinase/oxoprolinase family protein n=1 Tax=Methanolapillus millepedarum TaxID=3028296 RepID=A0AA96V318_9EURY|nr:hypothetical protein MsAc7_11540 [Methanosarcinaceae archaeon Ac7]
MNLGLGIDTGGTYTDAVLMDLSTGVVIEKSKALTTYPDLIAGISNAIDGLNPKNLKEIKFTSVSTTLATNTTLEGKGYPTGLILIGYAVEGDLPVEDILEIRGGHDTEGNALDDPALDFEIVEEFVKSTHTKVASYAISSYFSVRNPEHELAVKDYVQTLTDLPVVCGHELSRALGVYERTLTAVLNAQLIPVTHQFVKSISTVMNEKGISSNMMIMKCDGSLVSIEEALKRPVESVFSGPAASLVGAAHLTGKSTCVTIDVGGTSTDISMIQNGIPAISDSGAMVGGWKTMVKAIQMSTSALGGDSHVWFYQDIHIGPRRVVPLSLAAATYPELVAKLKCVDRPSDRILDAVIQGTSFFMGSDPSFSLDLALSAYEQKVYDVLSAEKVPMSVYEISEKIGDHPLMFVKALNALILKRYVTHIGFTPTDALHALGIYTKWNQEAAKVGAKILGDYMNRKPEDVCERIRDMVSEKMAADLAAFFLPSMRSEEIRSLVLRSPFTKLRLNMPVVLIGAPVPAYHEKLCQLLDIELVLPKDFDVGNAVGALVGDVIFRSDVLIRPKSVGSNVYISFNESGKTEYESYQEAISEGKKWIENRIYEHMGAYGLFKDAVRVEIQQTDIKAGYAIEKPLEIRLFGVGVGTPRKVDLDASTKPEPKNENKITV